MFEEAKIKKGLKRIAGFTDVSARAGNTEEVKYVFDRISELCQWIEDCQQRRLKKYMDILAKRERQKKK